MSAIQEQPTQPEIPVARAASFIRDRSAVYRRRTLSKPRDSLAELVEEVVISARDPRREP